MTPEIKKWYDWLTEERLERWNHIRERAGATILNLLTREQGAKILSKLSRKAQEQIKETLG